MTEQELRNKIAKHVCCACEMGLGDGECAEVSDYRKCGVCGDVADAIIAAGIGDVKDLQAQVNSLEITNIALQAGYDDAEKDRLYWVNKYKEAEHRAEDVIDEFVERLKAKESPKLLTWEYGEGYLDCIKIAEQIADEMRKEMKNDSV